MAVEGLSNSNAEKKEEKMSLIEETQQKIKAAMKANDIVARDCLRSIMSDIKNKTINEGKPMSDDVALKCIQHSVKQHNDSIKQFNTAGRKELAEKEEAELAALSEFLPSMLDEDETKAVIEGILMAVEATKKNFGKVMKMLPDEVDKKVASKILSSMLK